MTAHAPRTTLLFLGAILGAGLGAAGCLPDDEKKERVAVPVPAPASGTPAASGPSSDDRAAVDEGAEPGAEAEDARWDDPIPYDEAKAKKGKRLWMRFQCAQCHRVDGVGGTNGPDLSKVAKKYVKEKGSADKAREWFDKHLEDPQKYPGSDAKNYFIKMPKFPLKPEERAQLVELLMSFQSARK